MLVSLRDTRIENDSDNSTSYKYLLVRNVFLRATALECNICLEKKNTQKRPVSEAGSNIIVIIRRTRCAQTASHVDLLVSLRDTRIENDSDNSTSYKYLLVRNVFLRATALECNICLEKKNTQKRPELRTFLHSFFCFGFLSGDRKKMKELFWLTTKWQFSWKRVKNIVSLQCI